MCSNYDIHVSALTAKYLGLSKLKSDAESFQAYLMYGENCNYNCSFCSQAKKAKSDKRLLSRVVWPKFDISQVLKSFKKTNHFKKICFQVVSKDNYYDEFLKILRIFKSELDIPISASISLQNLKQADKLFENGLSRLGLALDASDKDIYKKIKKRNFENQKNLLFNLASKYPNKISTHLIVGLGETDKNLFELINQCFKQNIIVALFAFTPVNGSSMQNSSKVEMERYRIIQSIYYLLKKEIIVFEDIVFNKKGFIKKIDIGYTKFKKALLNGEFLLTSGCPLCNRPYYNDKPGKELYNYPNYPDGKIIEENIKKLERYVCK